MKMIQTPQFQRGVEYFASRTILTGMVVFQISTLVRVNATRPDIFVGKNNGALVVHDWSEILK